jgi:hypothetical protein
VLLFHNSIQMEVVDETNSKRQGNSKIH